MRVNSVIGGATVCFGGVLAVVIGYRIDHQTIVILTGVATGFVVAAIVVGLIAFFVIRQTRQPSRENTQTYHYTISPTGSHAPAGPAALPPPDVYPMPAQRPARQFVVIGEGGAQTVDGSHAINLRGK